MWILSPQEHLPNQRSLETFVITRSLGSLQTPRSLGMFVDAKVHRDVCVAVNNKITGTFIDIVDTKIPRDFVDKDVCWHQGP